MYRQLWPAMRPLLGLLLLCGCPVGLAVETVQAAQAPGGPAGEDVPLFPWSLREEDDGAAMWGSDLDDSEEPQQPQALRGSAVSLLATASSSREGSLSYLAEASSREARFERRVATEVQAERAERSQSRRERQMLRDMGRLESELEAAKKSQAEARQRLADEESLLQTERAERAIAMHQTRAAEAVARHDTMLRFADGIAFGGLLCFLAWALWSAVHGHYGHGKRPALKEMPKADFGLCSPDRNVGSSFRSAPELDRKPLKAEEEAHEAGAAAEAGVFKPSPTKCDAEAQVEIEDGDESCSTSTPRDLPAEGQTPKQLPAAEPRLLNRILTPMDYCASDSVSRCSTVAPPRCEIFSLVDGSRKLAQEDDARDMLSEAASESCDDASCMTEEDRWWNDAPPMQPCDSAH
eukprot:TRINITY_DN82247_c0_g1_i1.p1 TRINITY_DN82247_c0_g1~~TRINITY_DN82247_c0_g1_i1.p1  ORF type:complete len:408 (+),score=112.46 TRINITY_DN82247_c0_g1_i1:38-1261(+)